MNKKKIQFPLFWKFTIAIVLVVALFGSINLFFIDDAISDLSNNEINGHGITAAQIVVERSIDPILRDDVAFLNKIVSDNVKIDSSIAYIIILDKSDAILAHTFESGVPIDILNINYGADQILDNIRIVDKMNHNRVIRAMSAPILDGALGQVLLGIYEENFINSIQSINRFFLAMVLLFLFFGILVAFLFSYIITSPIMKISKISANLNLDALEFTPGYIYSSRLENTMIKFNAIFRFTDEIDVLTSQFDEMLMRLNNTYKELQSTQESLMQSEKIAVVGTFSSGIAHEINNPIAGIQNCLRRIAENPSNMEQNSSYIELMSEAINKIKLVVRGLLKFSRKHELEFTDVDLRTVVEAVLVLTAFQLERVEIDFKKEYQPNLPTVTGSANHLEQVVLNLLINAYDAVNERIFEETDVKGEITLKIYRDLNDVKLEISDNGVGVPSDKMNKLFDPFFTMKKIKQGTGLGLSVSYNIIMLHGGSIKVRKNELNGMCFTIALPLEKPDNE